MRLRLLTVLAAASSLASAARAQSPTCPPTAKVAPPPLATFAYDRRAPLDLRDSLESRDGAVTSHRVSFASPKGGRVTGYLAVPDDSLRVAGRRFAGLLLMHGAPGSAAQMRSLAGELARHGLVVLAIDAPFARRDPQNPLAFSAQDSVDQVQLMVDLQRAVDVLQARADVDAARIGYYGISYGGAMGAYFAGVERRVAAYAIAVGDGGLAHHFTQADGTRAEPLGELPAAQWCGWFASMEPLNGLRVIGRANAPLLFQWGRTDSMVPPHLADALWAAAPEPKERRWYESGHRLPAQARLDVLTFLSVKLGSRAPAAQ